MAWARVFRDPVGSKKIRGSNFLDGGKRVCDAIRREWYPLLREEIFYLKVF